MLEAKIRIRMIVHSGYLMGLVVMAWGRGGSW